MSTFNIWAVLVAAISTFVIGWLWYGPLFGKTWMSLVGLTEEKIQQSNMFKTFGIAFIFELVMAYNLAMFLNDPSIDWKMGALYGFLTGFGWIFLAIGVHSLFEKRSWKYIFINGGYWAVSFTVMGLILGAWK
ncbi:MAG TPA: DUF1761 domain-containing protein [Balneolales bacterium]|nr:DUF1761 domain-containing protein [Balneolales bacterium]HYX06666.1 DUF1761 domain-containing protein [Bacteroidales bacterium]